MLTARKGTHKNGQISLHETPPVQEETEVIGTFLDKETATVRENERIRRGGSIKGKVWMTDDFNNPSSTNQSKTSGKGVRLGSWEGRYSLPDDFNDPLDDLADYM